MLSDKANPQSSPGSAGRELPRDEWPRFFGEFSRDHVSDPVTVEVETPQGTRVLAEGKGLIGITADVRPDRDLIDLSVDGPKGRITHLIHHPDRVYVGELQEKIDIESSAGTTHVLIQNWGAPERPHKTIGQSQDPGVPGGGKGRKDATGITNVYPASGPLPPKDAPLQPMGIWGQADRGPEGYYDSGESEIIPDERLRERKKD